MEVPGKEFGFHSKSTGEPLDGQCFRSLGKESTLAFQGFRADFQLGQEGPSRVGKTQHKKKVK